MFMKIIAMLLISVLCLQACSKDALKDAEIYEGTLQYLAFQKFASGTMEPNGDYQPLLPLRNKTEIESFIQLLQNEISLESQYNRKLAVFIGPIALDHSTSSIKQLIDDSFDLAIEYDMPIGFHLDDGMFWTGREDLWKDPENIEWQDWQGKLSESRYVDWVQSRLAPQMCFNCPKVRLAMQAFLKHIAQTIKLRFDELKQQNKAYLFAGIITGWETSLDEEFSTKKSLGYHALANRGFSETNQPDDIDLERYQIVYEFIEFMASTVINQGIPKEKVYGHVAVFAETTYSQLALQNPNLDESYIEINGFATTESVINPKFQPGFSTYPQEGVFDQIYQTIHSANASNWISSEGVNMILGNPPRDPGYDMESYLARHYNYGARMVNLFAFGLRGGTFIDALNDAVQGPEAIAAYRDFLRGKILIE
jgi:hypothetical protein